MKDEAKSRARGRIVRSFIMVLIIALIIIGVGAYFVYESKTTGVVDDSKVTYTKICILFGLFLIFADLFFTLPRLFKKDPHADETEMQKRLSKYVPEGETLEAGIYAKATESFINATYRKCDFRGMKLVRDESKEFFSMEKRKYAEYTVYVGITQSSLLVIECDTNKHYYEYHDKLDCPLDSVPELMEDIAECDLGTRFNKNEIAKFKVKNGKQGSKNIVVTMKNGSYFKITIPDNAGPTANMPKHIEYSKKIIDTLKAIG